MMKTILAILSILISLTACDAFFAGQQEVIDNAQTITGTVIENSIEVPVDGNNVLLVETENGLMTVLYQEGGLVPPDQQANQCDDNQAVAQFARILNVGDVVEVYGASHDVYDMEVCSSTDFYVTVLGGVGSQTDTITVVGTVSEVIDDCTFDGICAYVITTNSGEAITVIWSEGDSPNCANNPFSVNEDVQSFQGEGERIEAFGYVVDDSTISVCGDESYYIAFLEDDVQATRQVTGEVTEFISDCAFDGICAYVITTDAGEAITVIWSEGMSLNCQNDMFNGMSSDTIVVGDTIDAFGRIVDNNTISTCGDESYYISKQQ